MAMLTKFKRVQEQWGGSSEVIDHWLDTRQLLIVEYCKLAALKPHSSKTPLGELPLPKAFEDFSQRLVDYISEGHFKIYDMVMHKWQATGFKATQQIDSTYANILVTTDPLLNFTDKYANVDADDSLDDLDNDLSQLGETLEARFNVEDELIQLIIDSLSVPPGA
jgi:regulator of sigma D